MHSKGAGQEERMDFLSFLTQAADCLVGFAKTFAGLLAALILFMVARCLPSRIRRYFSACATAVIALALLRDSFHQFSFFTLRAVFVNTTIACLTLLTFLFFVYIATYIARVSAIRLFQNVRRDIKCDSRIAKGFALRNDDICASNAYLSISPICIQ